MKLNPVEGCPKIFRRPGFKNLYLRDTFPGLGQKTICLGTPNIKEALLEAKRISRELLKIDPNYRPVTIRETLVEIIEINRGEWTKGTLEGAENIIHNRLIPVFGDIDIQNFREVHWSRFTDAFYRDQPKGKLFNTRKYLGKALRFAKRKGWISQEFDLPIQDKPTRRGRVITDKELSLILENAKSPAFKLQVLLGRYMGMRKDEILGLQTSEIDLKNEIIYLKKPSSKTKRHQRDMAIAPEVIAPLRVCLQSVAGPYLFPARENKGRSKDNHATWDRVCALAKVSANFHDLRHTFITTKIHIEKKPIQDVSAYVGTSIAILEKTYCHPTAEHTRHVVNGRKLRVVGQLRTNDGK